MLTTFTARRRGSQPDPPPGSDGESYAMPISAPWNAPTYLATPTYDGSGSTVHPDVIDFAQLGVPGGTWRGWRYWMIHTPFNNGDDALENPSALVSQQAATGWQNPDGLTNPIYPKPSNGWNNDVDLTYDPVADQLVMVYKELAKLMVARSSDGVTWPASATLVPSGRGSSDPLYGLEGASPALVRVAGDDWRIWAMQDRAIYVTRTADPTLLTGWQPSQLCSFPGMVGLPWHQDVIRHAGAFWAVIQNRTSPNYSDLSSIDGQGAGLVLAKSADGLTWSVSTPDPMIAPGDNVAHITRPAGWSGTPTWFEWDKSSLYRATIQPHENGTHMRLWYSARGMWSWRVGYLRLPLSLWPAL